MKPKSVSAIGGLLAFALLVGSDPAAAAQAVGWATIQSVPGPGGSTQYSLPLQTLLTLSALSFLPALLLMMTAFTRIVIVLSLLRMAMGTQSSPPNQVIIGLALFMTLFVMGPTLDKIHADAWQPYSRDEIGFDQFLERASPHIKGFMLRQTREHDLVLFHRLSQEPTPATPQEVSLRTLIPAFVTSELKSAFQIGFMVFLPFLIVDLIVASALMSLGMMMVSPVLIALPFKLMLFVLVDGWDLMANSLVNSFAR